MARLGVTTPNEFESVALFITLISEHTGIDFDDVLESQTELVDIGAIRWDADRFGWALIAVDSGKEHGFTPVPNVAELRPDVTNGRTDERGPADERREFE